VAHHIQVVDRVGTGHHGSHDHGHLARSVGALVRGHPHPPTREVPSQLDDQSVKNFDLSSSGGTIAFGAPISRSIHRGIKA
jgi:hypothetical protein